MDSFVIIRRQKKEDGITLHDREIQDLKRLLEEGKNVFICGAAGVGKSYILNRVLDESNSIEIYDEVLTKKDIYLDTIKNSNLYTYIENYETDNMYKSIIDSVSEGGWVTKRPLVVTSQNVHVLPNFKMLFIPKRKPESIERLQPGHVRARLAAEECRGNIRNFFSYLNFTDVKDIFKTSKEFIEELLCTPCTIDIEETVHEHGHIWDTVHENYLDSDTDHYDKIMDSLVSADTYDTELYKGDWDCMPYFVLHAIKIPKLYMKNLIKPEKIRPGSCWTKFGNQKMRYQKVRNIQARSNTKMGHQEFMLLREYALHGDVSKFKEYSLTPQDFDVMNHLSLQNKLKQRDVTKIKKLIKDDSL